MNLKIRTKILKYSLEIEHFVSLDLSKILEIQNPETSKSFGNNSSALSLNQKLNLLLDFNTISKKEKNIVESFCSIRNQFIHNYNADSYEYVINQISGLNNRLNKIYPQYFEVKNKNTEEIYDNCIDNLYIDSLKLLKNKKGLKLKKEFRELCNTDNENIYEEFNNTFEKNLDELMEKIENHKGDKIQKMVVMKEILTFGLKIEIDRNNSLKRSFEKLSEYKKLHTT